MTGHAQRLVCAATLVAISLLPAQEPGATTEAFRDRQQRRESFRNTRVRDAIRDGVAWLRAHQDDDGRWDCHDFGKHDPASARCDGEGDKLQDIGVSSLALLALLAQADAQHDAACRKGVAWLRSMIDGKTGRVRSMGHDYIYAQALATLAMAEAAELLDDREARDTAQSCMRYLQRHHNPGAAWRYQPADGENDTSASSWCIAAGVACRAAGVQVDPAVLGQALAWIDTASDAMSGRTGYSNRGEVSSRLPGDHLKRFPVGHGEAMTAAAQHARRLLGVRALFDAVADDLILTKPPSTDPPARDFYYWLHGSMAFGLHTGGAGAKKWEAAVQKTLLAMQRSNGAYRGSWDPDDAWGQFGGRIYATASNVLSLSAPFRCRRADPALVVPDVPPWRSVHSLWAARKFGQAAAKCEQVELAADDAAGAAMRARIDWHVAVFVARAEQLFADLAAAAPDALERYELLTTLADELSPLPIGARAATAIRAIDGDRAQREELQASRELRALMDDYQAAFGPGNKAKAKQVRKQLERIVERHPSTEAAKTARDLLDRLP